MCVLINVYRGADVSGERECWHLLIVPIPPYSKTAKARWVATAEGVWRWKPSPPHGQIYLETDLFDALEWLDRACAQRDGGLIGTAVDPLRKSLHNDPRYAALLKKLNLPS